MNKSLKTGLIAGAAVMGAVAAMPAQALEVKQVRLSYAASEKTQCPRTITMRVWAHTDGPGTVRFVIRKAGGGKSDEIAAQAVKDPSGGFRAMHTQVFTIPSNTDTQYMAEAVGHGKISAWMPLKETCGPQPRTETKTTGAPPRQGRPLSELNKDPKPSDGKPIPSGGGKPLPGAGGGGKPISQCKGVTTVKRIAAVTRAGGIATAWVAWTHGVEKTHGVQYSSVFNAKDKKSSCTGVAVYTCTVSARPCRS